jgi:hypothetical protein
MRYLNMPRGSAASAPDRISNISGHAHALSAASEPRGGLRFCAFGLVWPADE